MRPYTLFVALTAFITVSPLCTHASDLNHNKDKAFAYGVAKLIAGAGLGLLAGKQLGYENFGQVCTTALGVTAIEATDYLVLGGKNDPEKTQRYGFLNAVYSTAFLIQIAGVSKKAQKEQRVAEDKNWHANNLTSALEGPCTSFLKTALTTATCSAIGAGIGYAASGNKNGVHLGTCAGALCGAGASLVLYNKNDEFPLSGASGVITVGAGAATLTFTFL